jgi:hypothetical protein
MFPFWKGDFSWDKALQKLELWNPSPHQRPLPEDGGLWFSQGTYPQILQDLSRALQCQLPFTYGCTL